MADDLKSDASKHCTHQSQLILFPRDIARTNRCGYCNIPITTVDLHRCQDCNVDICATCIKLDKTTKISYYHAVQICRNVQQDNYTAFLENVSAAAFSTASRLYKQKLGIAAEESEVLDVDIIFNKWHDGETKLSLLMIAIKFRRTNMIKQMLINHVKYI